MPYQVIQIERRHDGEPERRTPVAEYDEQPDAIEHAARENNARNRASRRRWQDVSYTTQEKQ